MFHARLEPLRAFLSSYPMEGVLRISEKCGRPINGILSDTTSAFTDQPRLCCRKHRCLQHHPWFPAMINLQPRIRRPRCYSSGATGTLVAPTSLPQRPTFCALLTLPRTSSLALPQEPSPSCLILTFDRLSFADHTHAFFSSGDYSTVLLWMNSTRFNLQENFITTFTFSPAVYFC